MCKYMLHKMFILIYSGYESNLDIYIFSQK